jgi:2-dehydropantoate 2-reductase
MHVVLVGPGALGGLLAARLMPVLERHGGRLSLLDHRPDRAALLAENGITLLEHGRTLHVRPQVFVKADEIGGADVILLSVKSGDVAKALACLRPLLDSDTLLLGFQNGMSHVDLLRQSDATAAAGVTALGASLAEPGQVVFGGQGPTSLGLFDDGEKCALLDDFVDLMQQAGLDARRSNNILADLWKKLFINVGINALTAIHGRKNGQLLTSCGVRSTMKKAIGEAVAVAEKSGIPIQGDPISQTFAVCRKTRNNVSSMLQDVRRRRPTEIMAINGFVVREGERLHIDTPVNRKLVNQIRAIEASWHTHHAQESTEN